MRSKISLSAFRVFSVAMCTLCLTIGSAQADVILSSEDWEAATHSLDYANTAYDTSETVRNAIVGPQASDPNAAEGSDPTGQCGMLRGNTAKFYTLRDPLWLALGEYSSLEISYAVHFSGYIKSTAMQLEYSALGDFSDTQIVKVHPSTANLSGTPYELNRWYAGQTVTLDPETYTFTDTAKIKWRMGGSAMSHRCFLDDIVITGLGGIPMLYWDINGTMAGAGGSAPAGTWNATDPNWNSDYTGGGDGIVGAWTGGWATFGSGGDANGVYAVTVDGTQGIAGLIFEEGTVTLQTGASGALRMDANTVLSVAPGLTATVETPIFEDADSRHMSKRGAGTLELSGDLAHTGGTTVVDGGMLILSGNNVAAIGGITISAGATQFESPNAINGTARDVAVNAGGAVVFGSSFGDANIPTALSERIVANSAGTIAADNHEATNFDFDDAGLTAATFGAIGSVTYTGTLTPNAATYRLGGGGGTLIMANTNAITGAGNSLIVNGDVALAAANDYDGGTTLNTGVLAVGNDNSLGSGALAVNGGVLSSDSATARAIANPVVLAANAVLGDAVNNGKLTFTNTADLGGTTRTITTNSDVEFGGIVGNGGLTKAGTATLTLSNDNTYTSATNVNAGTLVLWGSNSTSGVTLNAGTLVIGNAGALGAGTFTIKSGMVQAAGTIVTTNNVAVNGHFTVGGTGALTLGNLTTNGDRAITNDNTTSTITVGDINIKADKTITFQGDGDTVVTGIISPVSGKLNKNGTGALTLSAANIYGGATSVTGGTLDVVGSCDSSAVTVTNSGTKIAGGGSVKSLTINNGAGYIWRFGDGGDHTMDIVDGDLTLNDAWTLDLVDLGDDPKGSQEYDLFTFTGNYNGSAVTGPIKLARDTNYTLDANSALDWDVDSIEVVVDINVTAGFRVYVTGIGETTLAGDADGDGDVDSADYIMIKTHFGGPPAVDTEGSGGDFNDNGTVDWDDMQILLAAFNKGAGADTIPEPASVMLLILGAAALLRRRVSHRRQTPSIIATSHQAVDN